MNRTDIALIASIGAAVVALLLLAGYSSKLKQEEWDRFASAHECKVVGSIKGDVFNTFAVGGNGQMSIGVGSTPDKTGYSCNDGMTYWR